jgi:hypothetical protein
MGNPSEQDFRKVTSYEGIADEGREEFGVKDSRGRDIGYKWEISRYSARDVPQDWPYQSSIRSFPFDSAEVYYVDVHVTRDRRRYGAANGGVEVPDLETAKRIVETKKHAAKKRYTKQLSVA